MVGCAIAATSVWAAAAGTARADHPPVRERDPAKAAAGVEGWGRNVEPSSKARRDAGVWAVAGAGALGVPSDRPDTTAFDLEGRTLGPVSAVTVVAKGKAHVVVTNARTVGGLLSAMRIEPDGDDTVAPPPGTPLHRTSSVRYDEVHYSFKTGVIGVPLRPRISHTRQIPAGYAETLVPGHPARVVRSYRVRFVNGLPASRRLVSSMLLRPGRAPHTVVGVADHTMVGEASWHYVASDLTAASPWLPLGTQVTVTNLSTGASVTVVINDRGPFGGRLIDLSETAFSRIAPLGQGVADVRISW